ncbi:MAG TPA: universal stress protein [Allocoleopsis sp.]
MFDRILVALDTLPSNLQVFDTALSLAKLTQSRLLLAHILLPNSPAHYCLSPEDPEDQEARHLEMLRSFHSMAQQANIGADLAQPLARPGDEICKLAVDWGADLIVMGRRGGNETKEPIDGSSQPSSVSNYVVQHASCPVLVLQHQEMEFKLSSPKIKINQRFMPLATPD